MAKYINKFDTQAEFEANTLKLDYPNINYIESGNTMIWETTRPTAMVEITLESGAVLVGCPLISGNTTITKTCVESVGFSSNYDVKEISIASGVTTIADDAFNNTYTEVDTLSIPNTITSIGDNAFYYVGANYLEGIVIDIATPPTLGSNAFDGTSCPIYVPAASVDTYKAASGWSSYSSRITAITN